MDANELLKQAVALLAEGVDRNSSAASTVTYRVWSPSSRRAWIEIQFCGLDKNRICVALLAEGVDRNYAISVVQFHGAGRPPRGGRG